MSSPAYNKQKGATFETDLVKYLRTKGYDTERLRLAGARDEGDIVVKIGGLPFIIEAKNVRQTNLGGWVKEAEVEAKHYSEAREIGRVNFAVVHKRRNQPIFNAYVTIPLSEWLDQITPPF